MFMRMTRLRLRTDIERAVVKGFAFPLGIEPGELDPPTQGYTITYTPGEDEEPDTYVFHVVVSHEKLRPLLRQAFKLLPGQVFAIVEIGSRDAYRSVDVYLGEEPITLDHFLQTWRDYEPLLLEDGSIAAGANSEDPFVEVFIDHWKGFYVHVPLELRDQVEKMLHTAGLDEVPQTWQSGLEEESAAATTQLRPVLAPESGFPPDIDELLMQLRHEWRLELNIDPETNIDEGGRELGLTLWHAIVTVDEVEGERERRADVSIWATAGSLSEMQQVIDGILDEHSEWMFVEVFAIDRVAYDERPDELADLPARRREPAVHLVTVEPWQEDGEGDENGGGAGGAEAPDRE